MARLSIHLLGAFHVQRDGETVTSFQTNKARALLAYLAVEAQRPQQRAYLAGLLWPEWPEAQARTYLRQALANVQHVLSDNGAATPVLLTTRDTIQFNPSNDVWLDVEWLNEALAIMPKRAALSVTLETITSLREAVALYRGDFLQGFFLDGCSAYEEWQLLTRERLQRQVVEALGLLIRWHEQHADLAQALRYAWQRVELEPLLEEGHQQLLRLLARNGQRDIALAHYQEYCRRLQAELDVPPSATTVALVEAIRAGEMDEASSATRTLAPPLPYPTAPQSSVTTTVFVAREAELAQLDAHLTTALAGQGHTVFVAGDAGEGKSLLIEEFARRAQAAHPDLLVAGGHCSSHRGVGDPFLPFREILAQLTGDFADHPSAGWFDYSQAERFYKALPQTIDILLTHAPELVDALVPRAALTRHVTQLLGEQPWRQRLDNLSGRATVTVQLQQSALFAQFTTLIQMIAAQQPLLLWLEDLQWVDLNSAALLFHCGAQLANSPLLIVGSYRPEEVALTSDEQRHPLERVLHELQHRYGEITIDLSRADGRHFVDAYLDTERNHFDRDFRATLYRFSRGHPLFTVELLRSMQERGDLIVDGQGCWLPTAHLNWQILPARVEAVIAERIQRLPPDLRVILDVASVQGERFTAQVIADVLRNDEQLIVHLLSQKLVRQHHLVAAEGIQRLGEQRLASYRFRHVLFQQYLYGNLDAVERAQFHESVAHALEALVQPTPEALTAIAGQLAWHYEQADRSAQALPYRIQAGKQALYVSAHQEALTHFSAGLQLLARLPSTPNRAHQERDLQMGLATALGSLRGHAHPESGQAYARALALWRQVGTPPDSAGALWGLWRYHHVRGDIQASKALAAELLVQAEQTQNPMALTEARHAMGVTWYALGEFGRARTELARGLHADDTRDLPILAKEHGQDSALMNRLFLAFVLWFQGFADQAVAEVDRALAQTIQSDDLFSRTFVHICTASLFAFQRDTAATAHDATIAVALAREHGFTQWIAWGSLLQHWAISIQQPRWETTVAMQESLDAWEATDAKIWGTRMRAMVAEAYAAIGEVDKGRALLADALTRVHASGERLYEAEILRLQGMLQLQGGEKPAVVESYLQQAIAVAHRQQARSLELRATVSLCRLWQTQGKIQAAQRQLADIYGWFTEGFNRPDLIDARQLLAELT